jgi:hypothetical protein
MGDVQPAVAEGPGPAQQGGKVCEGETEFLGVDDGVEQPDTLPVGLALMQQRGMRLLDARADESDEDRFLDRAKHRVSWCGRAGVTAGPSGVAVPGQDADARMLLYSSRSAPL